MPEALFLLLFLRTMLGSRGICCICCLTVAPALVNGAELVVEEEYEREEEGEEREDDVQVAGKEGLFGFVRRCWEGV